MDITYLGHSSFKLRGKNASVVTDPYSAKVGFPFPRVSADIITVSHQHFDHNNSSAVSSTSRREVPFEISQPGEYEVSEISVFGVKSFHDDKSGELRGENTIFVIKVDDITIAHLGDLGHKLADKQTEEIGEIDVLFMPIGGHYTIGPKVAAEVMSQLQPSIVVPMHYRTKKHDQKAFSSVLGLSDFLEEVGFDEVKPIEKLSLTKQQLPDEMEVMVMKA
jgi:L-ascorbate metabolism protein UlaG (beta-lactamase superfamily)